jgi:2-amino-4-hydroxy-6-hydroxymethyldihydropteridine diphosphokinase
MESPARINEPIYIGLGSNIEDRSRHLKEAIRLLQLHPDIHVDRCSSIYETDPVGYTEQAAFLNMVIEISSKLGPLELFHYMLEVESQLGRVRDFRWGPRTIDLDLLLYGQLKSDDSELLLPHPRMSERAFVLTPLLEITEETYPQAWSAFKQNLKLLDGKEGVRRWGTINSLPEE